MKDGQAWRQSAKHYRNEASSDDPLTESEEIYLYVCMYVRVGGCKIGSKRKTQTLRV